MGLFYIIFIALGGIAFFMFLSQVLFLFRRERDKILFINAILSLIYFVYIVVIILSFRFYEVLDHFLVMSKIQLVLMQLFLLTLIASSCFQICEENKRGIYYFGLVLMAILSITALLLNEDILFGKDRELSLLVFNESERYLMISPGFTVWRLLISLSVLVYGFFLSLILFNNRGRIRANLSIFHALALITLFLSAGFDHLSDSGITNMYYLLPIGLFINYVIISYIPFYNKLDELFKRGSQHEVEIKWKEFLNQASVIVVILNRIGHVEYINPYYLKITGYKENEVLGKDWFEFFVPFDQHYDVQSAFIEILEFDFHSRYRNPILTKFNDQRMIEWINVRFRGDNSQVTGSISVGVDITEEHSEMENLKKKLREAENLINYLKEGGKIN